MTSVQLITPPVSITGQQGDKAGEGGVCVGVCGGGTDKKKEKERRM